MELFIGQDVEKGITKATIIKDGITANGSAKWSPDDKFHIGKGADIASARAYKSYVEQQMGQDYKKLEALKSKAEMLVARMEHNRKELTRTVRELAVLTK